VVKALTDIELGPVTLTNEVSGCAIYADPMLERVFYNLCDNTIRYGETTTAIRIWHEQRGEDLFVIFEDNGKGIVPAQKERIFERGFGKNTGLGLFISREILAITGLEIRETGEYGKGARFEIRVPKGKYQLTKPA
jgi:signal transduction histidine kinase